MRRTLLMLALLNPFATLAQGDQVTAFVAGMTALEDSSFEEAIQWFEQAVAYDPLYADAHYGLVMAYSPASPLHDERRISRALERALELEPDNPKYLQAQLEAYRRTMPESRAYSTTDTRRPNLANRLLAVDPDNAVAHEELALNAFLEFDWRRQMARRQGGWDPLETGGISGSANRARARAEEHIAAALASQPRNQSVHRLGLRLAVLAEDDIALERTAERFAGALQYDSVAKLYLGLVAHNNMEYDRAEVLFGEALDGMSTSERQEFNRVLHLMEEDELASFREDSLHATERFWRSRDPLLMSEQNERQLEHYARMAMTDLLFAEPQHDLRGWSTPRGEVVVRYGMPDDSGRWLGDDFTNKRFGTIERWVYGGDDGFSLVFEDPFRSGDYDFISSASGEDDATRARSLFHDMPERYIHRVDGQLVDFPFQIATFKGEFGQTTLIAAYGVPVGEKANEISEIQSGAFILDDEADIIAEARHVHTIESDSPMQVGRENLMPDGFTANLSPSEYTIALEFENTNERLVGAQRLDVELPSYAGAELQVSDILLALSVEEGSRQSTGTVARGDFTILPAPAAEFRSDEPIYLYAEIYNLQVQQERTQYEIEAILRPTDNAGFLARTARSIFGGSPPQGVSVTFAVSGNKSEDGQYVILDASDQEPGEYELVFRVKDVRTNEAAESVTSLLILNPHEHRE